MSGSSGPRVSVSKLARGGVVLFSSTEGDEDALPYSVVIQDNGEREVTAYAVIWRCVGLDGELRVPIRSVFNFTSRDSSSRLAPHAKHSVSLPTALHLFWGQREIEISIDAVMVADGSMAGPDTTGYVCRWRGWRDAVADVFVKSASAAEQHLRGMLAQFSEEARVIAGTGTEWDRFGAMADRAGTYEECRALASGYRAASIAEELESGATPAIENIRRVVRDLGLTTT